MRYSLSIRVDRQTKRDLKRIATGKRISVSEFARQLIEKGLVPAPSHADTLSEIKRQISQVSIATSETHALLVSLIEGLSEMAEEG